MREKVKEFLKLTQFYELTNNQLRAMIEGDGIDSIMKMKFQKHFNIAELEEIIIPLYLDNFTEGELDEILEFLNSPIGQRMISVNNGIAHDINTITNQWFMDKYQRAISEM